MGKKPHAPPKVSMGTTSPENMEMECRWICRGKPGPAGIRGSLGLKRDWILSDCHCLEISLDRDWLNQGSLIVEWDSRVALSWVKAACSWKLRFYGNKLRNLLSVLRNVSLTHKTREANEIVHGLAKEGSSLGGSWVKWFVLDDQ